MTGTHEEQTTHHHRQNAQPAQETQAQAALLAEALTQLREIESTTTEASEHIMNALDHCFALQQDALALTNDLRPETFSEGQVDTLRELVETFGDLLMDVSTRLTFHDLISQRLVFAGAALQSLQLRLQKAQPAGTSAAPAADAPQHTAGTLYGPSSTASQQQVDSLLADLGL